MSISLQYSNGGINLKDGEMIDEVEMGKCTLYAQFMLKRGTKFADMAFVSSESNKSFKATIFIIGSKGQKVSVNQLFGYINKSTLTDIKSVHGMYYVELLPQTINLEEASTISYKG